MAEKEASGLRNLVIATNTYFPGYTSLAKERQIDDTDGIRGDLAYITIANATNLGVRVVIADGGSVLSFLSPLERFKDRGLTVVTSAPGRGPQRRRAFETATALPNVDVIGYIQVEKDLSENFGSIKDPFDKGAKIVIPSRNPELFQEHWPDYMRESELRVNAIYNWLMRIEGLMTNTQAYDWFFGPVFFRNDPEIVNLFLEKYEFEGDGLTESRVLGAEPNPEKHSDGHYFPIIRALFNNLEVEGVEIPYKYPLSQKLNESSPARIDMFKERRRKDAATYLLEAFNFVAYLKGLSESRIRPA